MTYFVLCADTEDNHPSYFPGWQKYGSNYDTNPAQLRFDWTEHWDRLIDIFRKTNTKLTWFIRTDNVTKDILLKRFKNRLLKLRQGGDEIGIHIHTLDWDGKFWKQTKNPIAEQQIVREAIRMFKQSLGFSPKVSRMGWNAMSNDIMDALEENRVQIDASAVPNYSNKGTRDNIIEWRHAPRYPYNPSYADYRKKGNMKIIECPISSMRKTSLLSFSSLMRLSFANNFLTRHRSILQHFSPHTIFTISPFWTTRHVKQVIDYQLRQNSPLIVGYFHPADIFNPRNGRINKHYLNKIEHILGYIRRQRAEVISSTLSNALRSK